MISSRARTLKLLGAIVCAYIVVLQAALGGLASARHISAALENPFGVICLNSADGADSDRNGSMSDRSGCCMQGCVAGAAVPASTPEAVPFVYDPRPTPRRSVGEREASPREAIASALKRPRGPPAIC